MKSGAGKRARVMRARSNGSAQGTARSLPSAVRAAQALARRSTGPVAILQVSHGYRLIRVQLVDAGIAASSLKPGAFGLAGGADAAAGGLVWHRTNKTVAAIVGYSSMSPSQWWDFTRGDDVDFTSGREVN